MPPCPVVFNGKFLNAPAKGLSRTARQLIGHVDEILETSGAAEAPAWELACRPDAPRMPLAAVVQRPGGRMRWDGWEQFELPGLASGKLLVSLCNMAPLAVRGSIVAIHDAHVFLMPESHSPSYAAWYRFALPRVASAAGRVLTVSAFSRDCLVEQGIAPAEKITVIPNGGDHLLKVSSDPDIVERLGLKTRSYVIALANAQRHKNIAVLLRAFALPAMTDMKLVLVGPAGEGAFAKAGLAVPANVVFAGAASDAGLRALYEQAVCLAFPSLLEGFGIPPLEAMSLGCPVIASPRAAIPEVCGDAATYLDPHDAAAWAAEMIRHAEDPALHHNAATAGLAQAAKFSWRESARQLLRVISEHNG